MSNESYLTCKRVTYYCSKDEDAFFEWIKKMPCIKSFEGAKDELYLDLVDKELNYDDIRDLVALFRRYKVDMRQLKKLVNEKNNAAFEPWRKEIFGDERENNVSKNEQWTQWEPLPGLTGRYNIYRISDIKKGLVIKFKNKDQKKVQVIFERWLGSYRLTDETFRYKLILDLGAEYGSDFYGDWTFFKVENSLYLKWLSEQSHTISDSYGCSHFAFIDDNSVFDIAAPEPRIDLID